MLNGQRAAFVSASADPARGKAKRVPLPGAAGRGPAGSVLSRRVPAAGRRGPVAAAPAPSVCAVPGGSVWVPGGEIHRGRRWGARCEGSGAGARAREGLSRRRAVPGARRGRVGRRHTGPLSGRQRSSRPRKTECDIRMRLPWVSNEHCKIEINENKEAVLTNLSSVNPTQLNGACFEQPVPLKHGDVLTIIDRSFRFEYPLQSTPKKRHSRSPKDETLQVAEVELLHKQTPGAKSLGASDNAECEEKNANENKQTPEENLPGAFPVKLQTPKSLQRIHHVLKKQNEMSPFSKLYESVKNELKVGKPLHRRSASQQAAKEDPGSVLPEPRAPISSLSCLLDLGSLAKGKETGRMGNTEKCVIVRREEENGPGFNQLSAGGRTPRRSFTRSTRAPISKEVSGDTSQSPLQDPKELRTPGRSRGAAVTPTPSKEKQRNSLVLLEQCSIERLECPAQGTVCSPRSCSGAEGGPCVLSTPTPRRKSPRSLFVSPPKETTAMNPGNPDAPKTPRRGSLKLKSLPEIPVGAPRVDPECRIDNTQLPLPEDKCLKQRRNSKQQTPGKPVQEVLKEIWDQADLDNSKVGHCETPTSLSNSKSPRRSSRESKEFLDKNANSEALATDGVLASPAGQTPGRKRGRPRSSGVLAETALETNTAQEQHESGRKASGTPAELAMDRCPQKQDLEDASATRPRRTSAKRRSPGSAAELRDTEPASETTTFGLLHGEDSGKTKRVSQKRKSGEMLPQTLGKRKRVSFGGHLSPELFDKSLPPNSPLKRGALPARQSLPCGNSPRAVLKKAQGLKHLIDQEEKTSPKSSPAQQPPGASSPVSTPKIPSGSAAPFRKGRFSISQPSTTFPIAEEKDAGTEHMDPEGKSGVQGKTLKSASAAQDAKAKSARGAQLALKGSAMKSRGGAVAIISAKRRSGASSANLLVAKSWAEVVKLGVARPQPKTAKKSVRKGRALKRINHPPKTPEKKIKGHFSTGHAESPATIVVGRAYSTTVGSAGHVPKVVKNPKLKLNMDMDESFTGVPEMFQTPENQGGRTFPLAASENADVTPPWASGDISDLHTPEESGEMMVSPLNNSDASEQKQESPGIFHLLREESSPSMFDEIATKTPEKRKAMHKGTVDRLAIIPEKTASLVKSGSKRRTPKHKLEPVEVMSSKRKILRTPEQRSEPGEVLSGIKRLMKTPRQKPEPTEVLSGIQQLLKTPKQKLEPVEVLSGIKQLLKTPKQKLEPVEVLSGIKQLLKTPKQKLEPVEVLSGIKQLLKTPKQKLEPVEVLSGIKELLKTPKQKSEAVEVLSGIRELMKTPKQKSEAVEVLSGIRELLKTPKQKSEAVEVLSGIRELMKTPKQKLEPVEVLSGIRELMKTPEQKLEPVEVLSGIQQLLKTPKQKLEPVEVLSGIKQLLKTPKQKLEPVEVLSGIKELMKTPKQKLEPVEVLSGIKELLKTPKQKLEPVEALSGIKHLMRTPRRKPESVEDLSGIKQLLRTPKQELEPLTDEIALKRLLETPVESREAVKAVAGVTSAKKTPKLKSQPVEDMVGIHRIFQTPKEKVEPVENMFGISRLMKSPKEKYQPVEDFVGLQRLMAEPKQKSSDSEVDYAGVTEMFGTPEEMKVRSVNVMDSQGEIGSNSSHKHEKRGKVSQGEDSQQKNSTGEEQPTQRPRRGRSRMAVPPAAAKPSENGVSLKELQSPDTQEEMGVITPEKKGRGRRTKRCIQVVPKCPDEEGLDIVSSVEPPGAAQRPGRGKRKELKKLIHPNENLESCVEDSSVLQKAPANTKQSLQDCGINETEDDPGTKTGPGNIQSEICQLQTDLNDPDSKTIDSGIEDSEEVLLSPRRRRRGVENTEPVIPPKRSRQARNDQSKAASPGGLRGTTRKLRKDPSPKVSQRQEQACDNAPEAVTAQESENGTKLELKATERRVKSLRSTRNRKHSAEIKADACGVALENPQNIQKTEGTSTETDAETQSHVENEIKGSQGCETENAQENTTEAARRLKAESPSAETNKMLVSAQNMEANRTRNRRGKKDSLEQKADEFTENVNSLKPVTPKFKSETEVDESSLQDSVGSVCVNAAQARKEQPSPGGASVPAADSARPAQGSQRRTRNEQRILKAKQTEILQGSPAQRNTVMCSRGRGKKVNFQLEEGSSKAIEGKSLPEADEGMTDKDNQRENSENPSSQGRRGRRKQLDSIPQKTSPAFMEKQALSADHRKDEAVVQEPGSALEAAPSSAEDNPPRRGRRREVTAASQTRSPSVRTRRGLLQGDAKKIAEREEENPALSNKTLQAKVNAPARDRRKKMDSAAEARSSTPLQRKCGLSETKDEGTQEEQSVPLEAVSCAEEKPPGRGRRKETALAPHTTSSISLRGKRGLLAGDGEEAPKGEQNVPLETCDPSGKENRLRRGRRKEIAPLIEARSSIQGNQVLSKQSGRKNNSKEAKQNLDNSSQENTELVKESSRQATISLALSPTSLQGLSEDGKDRIPEEQSKLLDVAPPAKENPSRVGRKKTASSTSEEAISTSLRGKPDLPRGRGQKRILKGHEDASPENNPCQGRTRQLRNNRRKVEVPLEAATSTPHKSSDLPENGNTLGTRGLSGASTGSEENQSGKGQEGDPAPQAAPTSRRRKCHLPAEEVAPKKLKSGNDENGSLQRGRRNKTKLGEEDARAAQITGGMEKRTRSSTRTRK
ncbi:proliferation marker protein Ki-67 isoform X3 [Anomalospiza imberbis]|uniref:proliferation marker protein Ki-67 isoform X3 n=1 Tax=Anomalospiza imberbis TaxID=187417 RepID=UPI00358F9E00